MYRCLLLIVPFITACSLSGGIAGHHAYLDSEFQDGNILGFVQGEMPVTNNIYLYARHESIPFQSDRNENGSGGVNSIGVFGRIDFTK